MRTMIDCRASRACVSMEGNKSVYHRGSTDLCDERARIKGRKMENVSVSREQEVGKCVLLKMIGRFNRGA